eukprot:4747145-Prymnesium_polylepis.1
MEKRKDTRRTAAASKTRLQLDGKKAKDETLATRLRLQAPFFSSLSSPRPSHEASAYRHRPVLASSHSHEASAAPARLSRRHVS